MSTRTRRAFAARSLAAAGAVFSGAARAFGKVLDPPGERGGAGGGARRLGLVPLSGEHRRLENLYGTGLSGRSRLDLARLSPETLIIPNARFFVRTRCPDQIDLQRPWTIGLEGELEAPRELRGRDLAPLAAPMGVHLIECSGSGTGGLISAAAWTGIPLERVLATMQNS